MKISCSSLRDAVLSAGMAVVAVSALACAKATIKPGSTDLDWKVPKPVAVYIYPFAIQPTDIAVNSGMFSRAADYVDTSRVPQEQAEMARQVQQSMGQELVAGIEKLGFSASVASYDEPPPPVNALVIEGQFVRVDEGAELRRIVIGLGLGKSWVAAQVQVYETTASKGAYEQTREGRQLLLAFSTYSHGGEFPGVAVGAAGGPIGGGIAAARAVEEGVSEHIRSKTVRDVNRAAKQIGASLSAYMATQGWIPAEQAERARVDSSS